MTQVNWRLIKISSENLQSCNYTDNTILTARYTLLTFFPKAIYEQFRKKSNFFFLFMVILQLTLPVPTNPSAYIITFTLILSISLIKQAYEDWFRHKTDNQVNNRIIKVFDNSGTLVEHTSRSLRVGQIIRLEEDEPIPCDLLLLSSIAYSGETLPKCEITTANLDGEPNRKVRICPPDIPVVEKDEFPQKLYQSQLEIEYDEPNANLYKFNGLLFSKQTMEKPYLLSMDNVLLRGTTLKNCHFIFGIVLYTGKDTRLSLNTSVLRQNKFSVVDTATNKMILTNSGLLFMLCSITLGVFVWFQNSPIFAKAWYLPEVDQSQIILLVTTVLLMLVYVSSLIPISLSVSVEIQKVGSSALFTWDEEMSCPKTGNSAICNNSDVVEELGQIDYLLTDKTGTLTQNNLNFVCCSVGTRRYNYEFNFKLNRFQLSNYVLSGFSTKKSSDDSDRKVVEFLEAIALCHTVQAVYKEESNNNENETSRHEGIQYSGSSLDEEVLVKAAQALGITFLGDDNRGTLTIDKKGTPETFIRHLVFEFDADRKCMSVIVEDEDQRIFLITKGAESSVLPKCLTNSSSDVLQNSLTNVNDFARQGYRTLIFAKREVSRAELKEIQKDVDNLRRNPSDTQEIYAKVESNLSLLGTTGVEDQLQTNVSQTLVALKEAGIRIWMLTGDKMETAVNIGMTCGLIPNMQSRNYGSVESSDSIFSITNAPNPDWLIHRLEIIKFKLLSTTLEITLVIDGCSFAIGYENCRELLTSVAIAATQVVFCRMAPLQKSQVVKLIKSSNTKKIKCPIRVCAVGDGGNDVAMIQEAHVGIGILGREGRQAGRAADFAIPEFQHLQKAILVHGNWNYYRLANLVAYFFYRSFLLALPQLFYGVENGFSGQPVFDSTFMMLYALIFSSLPILFYGFNEQQYSAEELLRNPSLYKQYKGNELMSLKWIFHWSGIIIWHIFLIVWFPKFIWAEELQLMDWAVYSNFISSLVLALTDLKLMTRTVHFNWLTLLGQVISFGSSLLFYILTTELFGKSLGGLLKFSYFKLLSRPDYWCLTFVICVMASLPDFIMGGNRRLKYTRQLRKDAAGRVTEL